MPKRRTFIFNGPSGLRQLQRLNFNLAGAHLHFNGPFDLRDLMTVDLRNTTLVINDYQGLPPCSSCGKPYGDTSLQMPEPVLPPTPEAADDNPESPRYPARKRVRTREPNEDGELGSSSSATRSSTRLLASGIHPDRVSMLKDPVPEVSPLSVIPMSKTAANGIEMPFNRLEARHTQQAKTRLPATRNERGPPHLARSNKVEDQQRDQSSLKGFDLGSQAGYVAPSAESEDHAARINEERVHCFLRRLESCMASTPQQTEDCGRLSPVTLQAGVEERDQAKSEVAGVTSYATHGTPSGVQCAYGPAENGEQHGNEDTTVVKIEPEAD